MHPSHRRHLNEEIEIEVGDGNAAKDDYGLIPEGDWIRIYTAMASIQLMGSREMTEEQRNQQENRYVMVLEPPEYAKLDNDMRTLFRGREGIIESVAYKYDFKGTLDRVTLVVREVESSGTEEI